jgi:hypothetical protein
VVLSVFTIIPVLHFGQRAGAVPLTWTSQNQTGLLKFYLKIRSGKYKISLLSDKIIDIIQIASPSLPTDRNDGNYRELRQLPENILV